MTTIDMFPRTGRDALDILQAILEGTKDDVVALMKLHVRNDDDMRCFLFMFSVSAAKMLESISAKHLGHASDCDGKDCAAVVTTLPGAQHEDVIVNQMVNAAGRGDHDMLQALVNTAVETATLRQIAWTAGAMINLIRSLGHAARQAG